MNWNDNWLCYVCAPNEAAAAPNGAQAQNGSGEAATKSTVTTGGDDGGAVFQLGSEEDMTLFDSPNFCNLNAIADPNPPTFRFGSVGPADATDDGSDNDSITNDEIPGWFTVCHKSTRKRVARERHTVRREAGAHAPRHLEIMASKRYAMHIQPLPRNGTKTDTWKDVAGFIGQR